MSDYVSNLTAPDLRPYFKHMVSRVLPHSLGHEVMSDWADKSDDDPVFGVFKQCGFWTRDEAGILYHCALRAAGWWLDIGAHTGWTAAHLIAAAVLVEAVDYMYGLDEFRCRTLHNSPRPVYIAAESNRFFSRDSDYRIYAGCVIDGDHDAPQPLRDAQNCAKHLRETGVILLHDGVGAPVQDAVLWLADNGFKFRPYFTPYLVFVCWRGDFVPPDHVPDPSVKALLLDGRLGSFPLERAS